MKLVNHFIDSMRRLVETPQPPIYYTETFPDSGARRDHLITAERLELPMVLGRQALVVAGGSNRLTVLRVSHVGWREAFSIEHREMAHSFCPATRAIDAGRCLLDVNWQRGGSDASERTRWATVEACYIDSERKVHLPTPSTTPLADEVYSQSLQFSCRRLCAGIRHGLSHQIHGQGSVAPRQEQPSI